MLARSTPILALLVALAVAGAAFSKDKPTAPGQSAGPTLGDAQQYQRCLAMARQSPSDGWEEALAWTSLGGGDPARHCSAIALIGLRQFDEAAKRLEALAQSSRGADQLRAEMLGQAGQAWLLAKDHERAYAAQTAALRLDPDSADLLIDRSESLAAAKNYKEALADLDHALALAPNRADALTFRATAKRFLDDRLGAAEDIAKALSIDPKFADAWLEDGILQRLAGNGDAARRSWNKVLELAPETPSGEAARRNVELLDVKSP